MEFQSYNICIQVIELNDEVEMEAGVSVTGQHLNGRVVPQEVGSNSFFLVIQLKVLTTVCN